MHSEMSTTSKAIQSVIGKARKNHEKSRKNTQIPVTLSIRCNLSLANKHSKVFARLERHRQQQREEQAD